MKAQEIVKPNGDLLYKLLQTTLLELSTPTKMAYLVNLFLILFIGLLYSKETASNASCTKPVRHDSYEQKRREDN
ncbi:hypothetical protein U1Q18_010119, partial [Sarracenia purpurea var. burkii]